MTALRALALLASGLIIPSVVTARDLTVQDRVRCQESIERVYYTHQVGASLPFEEAVSSATLQRKVATYLKETVALETIWNTRITPDMLLRETERMARQTRAPDRLRELFAALGDDPFLIQECLARPALADRLARNFHAREAGAGWDAWWQEVSPTLDQDRVTATASAAVQLVMPGLVVSGGVMPGEGDPDHCFVPESWTEVNFGDLPPPIFHARAVWTGNLMIFWGPTQNGWRYDPATDFWTAMTTSGAPHARTENVAVWTGSEMLVWGGFYDDGILLHGLGYTWPSAGGRYDPVSDTWRPTTGGPSGRSDPSAVWTGRRMIVWGGYRRCPECFPTETYRFDSSGGQYDPATDTWTSVTMTGAPQGRSSFPAVWSGNEMIVWGGRGKVPGPGPGNMILSDLDSGGRYDPNRDVWTAMSTVNAPTARSTRAAVWTGHLMVVWGGEGAPGDTGGRYDPVTDTWTPTAMTGAPSGRGGHSAVWTGDRMIVWGGTGSDSGAPKLSTGGRYDPVEDSWSPTSNVGPPSARTSHTAVWTGSEMIVWGGLGETEMSSGGRYSPGGPIDRSGETETCDGVDDDCNGTIDEGFDAGAACSERIDACHTLTGARICRQDGIGTECSGTMIVSDATPPVIDLPVHLVALATSPAGATVTWSASAQDACSGTTGVVCVPPSGSPFAISPTGAVATVACSAVDASGNGASGNFEVHVAGAVEQLGDLKFEVQHCNLTEETAKRLVKSIEETLKALAGDRTKEACGKIDKITGEIVRDAGKKKPQIPADESGMLLETTRRISAVLGC